MLNNSLSVRSVSYTNAHAASVKLSLFLSRFYKFDETSITCLKFSFEVPNHLAIGFYDGELLIVDVSYSDLQVVFQKSKQSSLDTNDGVLDLFWTPMYENDFDSTVQHECLVRK